MSSSPGVPDPDPVRSAPAPRPRQAPATKGRETRTGLLHLLLQTRASGRGFGTARARGHTHLGPRGGGGGSGGRFSGPARAVAARSRGPQRGRYFRAAVRRAASSATARGSPGGRPGGRARPGPRLHRARPRLCAGPRGLSALLRAAPQAAVAASSAALSGLLQRGGPGPQSRPRRPLGRGPHSARRTRRRPVRLRGGGGGAACSPGCAAPAPAASPPRGRGASLGAREVLAF